MRKGGSILVIFSVIILLLFSGCSNPTGGDVNSGNKNNNSYQSDLNSCTTLAGKFAWLQENVASNTSYTIEVNEDDFLVPQALSYSGKSNVTITLKGIGAVRNIWLAARGPLFVINSGVTLILDSNIILSGDFIGNSSLIMVVNGGSFIMKESTKITYCSNDRAISIWGGTFTMQGGEISNNLAGGGVFVGGLYSNGTLIPGTFTMEDGIITNNYTNYIGGGVLVGEYGTFIMSEGTISNNYAFSQNGYNDGCGAGVAVSGYFYENNYYAPGTFIMTGGTITDNTADSCGGGVYVECGIFSKSGGTITGYSDELGSGNVVLDEYGNPLSNMGNAVAAFNGTTLVRRESTADNNVKFYFDWNAGSPIWSGSWEY